MHGQEAIVEEVIGTNPELARVLDSEKSSPLHIASARGHFGIAAALLAIAPETCWWRDCHGMNPVHVAAINGHTNTLRVLIPVDPLPAKDRVRRGQNVLHLCLKHGMIGAFTYLVENLNDLVYVEDDDRETILHSAIRLKKVDFVRCLIENHPTYELPKTSKGKTVHQISRGDRDAAIDKILSRRISYSSRPGSLRGKMSDITMVVVVLIATMAFQAAVSPPGGVWQEDGLSHKAGDAVMATTHPNIFKHFVRANTIAFISSLITIFLITTRQPSGRIFFLLIAVYATWVSLAAIAVSYGASIMVITPNTETQSLVPVIITVAVVSLSIMGFILVSRRIQQLYLSWKSKTGRGENLTNDSLIKRTFYLIFQQLHPVGDNTLERVLASVL